MSAIEIRGLTKRYGAVSAVDDLNFDVPAGSVTGFLGPNGAGKTTTLRMLLGLAAPTAGSATFGGCRYADLAAPALHVGAVLETTGFHPAGGPVTTCGSSPRLSACRPRGSTRCSTASA